MIVHSLHPIDAILADIGMMARRAKVGTLTPSEFRAIEPRIRDGLVRTGSDPAGVVAMILDGLVLSADARDLTHPQVERACLRMRERLVRVRDGSLPVVPNFAVLPTGVHGRRIGPLTVFDGGRGHTPQPLKGA